MSTSTADAYRGGIIESSRHCLVDQARLECAAGSWRGAERSRNEDHYVVASLSDVLRVVHSSSSMDRFPAPPDAAAALLAVADGMGGGSHGHVASAEAVAGLLEEMARALREDAAAERLDGDRVPGARRTLQRAFAAGQQRIERASEPPSGSRGSAAPPLMGTTLTVAYLVWPVMYLAHAGDSRCYLLRDGQVVQLTRDHTVAQKMIEEGVEGITPDSRLHHVLYHALGGAGDASHEPEIRRIRLAHDDVVILASDGLTGSMDMVALAQMLGRLADVREAVHAIGQHVLRSQVADDATLVVGWVRRA